MSAFYCERTCGPGSPTASAFDPTPRTELPQCQNIRGMKCALLKAARHTHGQFTTRDVRRNPPHGTAMCVSLVLAVTFGDELVGAGQLTSHPPRRPPPSPRWQGKRRAAGGAGARMHEEGWDSVGP
jgi:hypothetical protein